MSVLFVIALCLAGIAALILPYYCMLTYRGKTQKTLILKMILSSTFAISAILAVFSVKARGAYAYIMLAGFLVSVAGDYLLGKSERMRVFVAGSCCFAAAHILYIIALSLASRTILSGQIRWFNGMEAGIYIALVSAVLLIALLRRPPFHKLFIPMFAYYFILCLMVTKAFGLGIRWVGDFPSMIMLPIGAAFFLCSDYMLGMMRFKMHARNVPFKTFCTASYFAAQTLMALSLFTIVSL